MAQIGLSITKRTAFRDSTQEFSNVYFYIGGTLPDNTDANAMIDLAATREKTFHSTDVTFQIGRLWSQVGDKSQNNMIAQKQLSGTGARPPGTADDKERAFLFRLRAGSDSRGNPVYLRKWFHACGAFVSTTVPSNTILRNNTGWTQAERDAQVAQMNSIGDLSPVGTLFKICAKSGRQPTPGANWEAHKYLEHHQLGDQWRAV
jgi:hypothetical protein